MQEGLVQTLYTAVCVVGIIQLALYRVPLDSSTCGLFTSVKKCDVNSHCGFSFCIFDLFRL
jgi:hypothetical protein